MQDETTRSRRGFLKSLFGLAAVAAVGGAVMMAPSEAEAAPLPPKKTPEAPADTAPDSALPASDPTYWVVRRRRRYVRRRVVYARRRRYYRRRYYY